MLALSFPCLAVASCCVGWIAQSIPHPVEYIFPPDFLGSILVIGKMLIVLNVWDKLKRKPWLEDNFANKKQSRDEDERLEREMNNLDERTERRIEALDRRREQGEKDTREMLHREISGNKQFISDRIAEIRESNSEKFAAVFAKLDSYQVTIQGRWNDVRHQIGRLEGQMDGGKKSRVNPEEQQERREESRREVLRHLAQHSVRAFRAETIRQMLAREYDFTLDEINAALSFLGSDGRVSSTPDPQGATLYFRVTAEGTRQIERFP